MRHLPGAYKSPDQPEKLLVSLVEMAHLLVSWLEGLPKNARRNCGDKRSPLVVAGLYSGWIIAPAKVK